MKRTLGMLTLLVVWSHSQLLFAQESVENELEFVRQLRAKGWNDRARTKIEDLLKRNDPILAAALPLELARVNIAEAKLKDPDQRLALFTAARGQLQEFIKKNKGAQAALAQGELARLTSYHAQSILSKAMREDEAKERHERARPAEVKFIEASKDLEEAVKAIEAALADPSNAPQKAVLERELKQARFDVAVNVFNQARTYLDKSKDDVNEKRANAMAKAKAAFITLRSDESSQVGWLANAWLMKLSMELTIPDDVNKYHDFIVKRKDDKTYQPDIQPAVRLVRYFALQDLTLPREDPETIGNNAIAGKNLKLKITPVQRLDGVMKEAELWLKTYPGHLKSFEGQGVLYELAYANFTKAFMEEKEKKNAGASFDKAVKYFDQLADLDGDLSERARQMSMSIKFKRLDLKAELKTFDENYMKAMIARRAVIQLSQQMDDPKLGSDRKKLEQDRKKNLKEVINALNKALALATNKTPVQKVDDARYYLCGAYLAYGDMYRGAIVGEALGRARSTRRSPEGASTALATYSSMLSREPNNAGLRSRLQDLAQFVLSPQSQASWNTDPVTSLAHYHLALSAQRDNKPAEAIAHLEKVTPDFTDYVYTQGQLVFIIVEALGKSEDKKEQKQLIASAKAALARMPKINPKGESSSIIAMYFFAKLENSKFIYREAIEDLNAREELKCVNKCKEMAKFVKDLITEFEQVPQHLGAADDFVPNGRISKKNHEQLHFSMQIMLKYSDLGIAEAKFRGDGKDRFDQVIEATKTVVGDVLAKAKASSADNPIRMKDFRVTGDILGLALRANVQKGDVPTGKAILDALQRLSGPNPDDRPGNVIAVLLNDIAGQIKSMKDAKDPALKTTSGNYIAFLDVIAKEFEQKGFDTNSAILLAHAYSSLDFSCKAASMFSKLKAPALIEKKIEKKKVETDDELKVRQTWETENNRYWGTQIEYVRALRACKDKDSGKEASKVVEALINHPNATYKIQAMMEKNLILEDEQKYRLAFTEWQKFMKQPSLVNNLQNKDVQKVYFTAYFYSARTLYKTAMFDPAIKDRPKLITAAANMIIKLEFSKQKAGWEIAGPLFQEYLKDKENESLKTEYERLKALQEKGGSSLNQSPRFLATSDLLFSRRDASAKRQPRQINPNNHL